MAFSTRKSVVFIKQESTEATLVAPASGTEAIAVQEGFSVEAAFETLSNDELSAGVGAKAPILGLEAPTAEVSAYIRHSGVEATAPNYDQLIKSAIGEKVAAFTEKVTTTSSTAGSSTAPAVIKLASGGSDLQRGHSIMIKDTVYSIRPVMSVATNDLTLAFNLNSAPGTGISTGRPILYKPSDTLPSNSLWVYRGNEAAVEAVAGVKVTEMSIEANAGELLSGSFSMAGSGYYFDPIIIASTDQYLDFEDDAGVAAAIVPARAYKEPHELAQTLQEAMAAVTSTTPTVTYSDTTGKFTIKTTGTLLTLKWSTGTNTLNTIGDKLGFVVASDDSGTAATTGYTSDSAQSFAAPYTPTADSNVNPLVVKHNEVLIGDSYDSIACQGVQSFTLSVGNEQIDIKDICAESAVASKILSKRNVTCEMVVTLSQYEASFFKNFRQGDDVRFCYNGGVKSGGNWIPGRCVSIFLPQSKISAFAVTDTDTIVTLTMTLTGYMPSDGAGDVYMNFL